MAQSPGKGFAFPTGPESARQLGYSEDFTHNVPESVRESFCGVGNPLSLGPIEEGEVVVDVGCGAGFDAFIAAQHVGPTGKVVGLDMTKAMLEKASEARDQAGWAHVEFREGDAEQLTLEDASVDVLISNGVFNLCPDKEQVFREAYRVLKSGGRFMVADMILERPLPPEMLDNPKAWSD